MIRKKKKGSSMLLTIAIFGILSIVGSAALVTAYSSYKLRIDENNRVKNLYSAESGIEQAYEKLCEAVDEELERSINLVNEETARVKDGQKELSIKEQNQLFKKHYIEYISAKLSSKDIGVNPVSGEYEVNTEKGGDKIKAQINCSIKNKLDNEAIATLEELDLNRITEKEVTITSSYIDINGKERIISVNYTLAVPDDLKNVDKVDGHIADIVKYSIATDENLNFTNNNVGANGLRVYGDIWIRGRRSEDIVTNPTEDKYFGGIDIKTSKMNFLGEINTAANINVDNSSVNFNSGDGNENNVFAENIFMGNYLGKNMNETRNAIIDGTETNLYLRNDLVIGASDSQINIKNLYGFSDTNRSVTEFDNLNAAKGASSIIINSTKWPLVPNSLKVNESAYIMGSAYINTKTPYQTGESVAYKENYKAYTKATNDEIDSYKFEYLQPLVLLNKNSDGGMLTFDNKVNHFVNYSKSNKESLTVNGISLPKNKTYTAGAYISDGEVYSPCEISNTLLENLKNYGTRFVESVYYMNSDISNCKSENPVKESIEGIPKTSVQEQVNWSSVEQLISSRGNSISLDNIEVILNDDENKVVNISNNSILLGGKELIKRSIENGRDNDEKIKYIVVTKGPVEYSSTSDFNGVIIGLKDISVKNSFGKIGVENGLGEEVVNSVTNKGVLDLIFSTGDGIITQTAVSSADIISKEKWSLKK